MGSKDDVPLILTTLLILIVSLFQPRTIAVKPRHLEMTSDSTWLLQENSFKQISSVNYTKPQTYASVLNRGMNGLKVYPVASNEEIDSWFVSLEYETFIRCLAKYESNFNPNAIGDSGRARSILQFHRPTFDTYCEGDYLNPRDQAVCCNKMLLDDWANTWHWTTAKYCKK